MSRFNGSWEFLVSQQIFLIAKTWVLVPWILIVINVSGLAPNMGSQATPILREYIQILKLEVFCGKPATIWTYLSAVCQRSRWYMMLLLLSGTMLTTSTSPVTHWCIQWFGRKRWYYFCRQQHASISTDLHQTTKKAFLVYFNATEHWLSSCKA